MMDYHNIPWSIEDTIENLEFLKRALQAKVIKIDFEGKGKNDADEVRFDFDRAINALRENQEYKKLGTLEEVRQAVEKQISKKPKIKMLGSADVEWWCPTCGKNHIMMDSKKGFKYCHHCGQRLDWSEEE